MLKNLLFIGVGFIVAIAVLGVAGFAYAQSQTPPAPDSTWAPGYGRGMMGGWRSSDGQVGPLHDYMVKAMAAALGMDAEELDARIDKGETPWSIAQQKGISQDDFIKLMQEARKSALEQAVADKVITQAQADWMLNRMQGLWNQPGFGMGYGPCHGGFQFGRGGGRRSPAAPGTNPWGGPGWRWNAQPTPQSTQPAG